MSPLEWLGRTLRNGLGGGIQDDECFRGKTVPGWEGCDRDGCDSVRLSELRPGARVTVTCLEEPWSPAARKLAAMGILPGAPLELFQRYPAFVFRTGSTEFAVDEELAAHVRVRARA